MRQHFLHDSRVLKAGFFFLIIIFILTACVAVPDPPPPDTGSTESTNEDDTGGEDSGGEDSGEDVPSDEPQEEVEEEPQEPDSLFPMVVTDRLDRAVTIDAQPERIISLAPSVTETLYAIGAGQQVVARTDFDNYPEEVLDLPSVGGFTSDTISIETILDLEPDLIIAGSVFQADLVETLEGAGLTVLVSEPASLDEIIADIFMLASITGHSGEADALVGDIQVRAAAIAAKIAGIPENERVTVFYEIWHEPLMTATNTTYIGGLITAAGGANIFGDVEGDWPTVSAEQIIAADPDVILGPDSHADQLTAEAITARPGWDVLTAVQENRVVIINGDIVSRPGPRVIDALEAIAAGLYPELFED